MHKCQGKGIHRVLTGSAGTMHRAVCDLSGGGAAYAGTRADDTFPFSPRLLDDLSP